MTNSFFFYLAFIAFWKRALQIKTRIDIHFKQFPPASKERKPTVKILTSFLDNSKLCRYLLSSLQTQTHTHTRTHARTHAHIPNNKHIFKKCKTATARISKSDDSPEECDRTYKPLDPYGWQNRNTERNNHATLKTCFLKCHWASTRAHLNDWATRCDQINYKTPLNANERRICLPIWNMQRFKWKHSNESTNHNKSHPVTHAYKICAYWTLYMLHIAKMII